MRQQEPNDTKAVGYKRGVFVLVRKFPSGADSYITFKFKKGLPGLASDFYLAIFNELQFANWFLSNLVKELKNGAKSDMPAEGPFFILEILDQARWDYVRKVVLADGVAKDAMLNPCEETETHRCPWTLVRFEDYADFNKLNDVFSRYPNQHQALEGVGEKERVILFDPIKLIQDNA